MTNNFFAPANPEVSSAAALGRTRVSFGNNQPTSRPAHQANRDFGGTSIQFGVSDDAFMDDRAPAAPAGNARVVGGALRMNMANPGVIHDGGARRSTTATPSDGTVLGSARSFWGSVIGPADLKADDLVDVGGMKTTVAVAEHMGLIRKEAGGYVEIGTQPNGASPRAPQVTAQEATEAPSDGDPAAPPVEAFSRSVEDGINAVVAVTEAGTQLALVDAIAREGVAPENLVNRLASQAGIEPGEAARFVEGVRGEFEAQAAKSLAKMGVSDMDHFGYWASQEGLDGELSKAIMDHVTNRSTGSYAKLAAQYVESLDRHSPDLLLGADFGPGIEVVKGNDGSPLLNIGGRTYSWPSAVRAGLVKVSSR